jgi:hypothetical protein
MESDRTTRLTEIQAVLLTDTDVTVTRPTPKLYSESSSSTELNTDIQPIAQKLISLIHKKEDIEQQLRNICATRFESNPMILQLLESVTFFPRLLDDATAKDILEQQPKDEAVLASQLLLYRNAFLNKQDILTPKYANLYGQLHHIFFVELPTEFEYKEENAAKILIGMLLSNRLDDAYLFILNNKLDVYYNELDAIRIAIIHNANNDLALLMAIVGLDCVVSKKPVMQILREKFGASADGIFTGLLVTALISQNVDALYILRNILLRTATSANILLTDNPLVILQYRLELWQIIDMRQCLALPFDRQTERFASVRADKTQYNVTGLMSQIMGMSTLSMMNKLLAIFNHGTTTALPDNVVNSERPNLIELAPHERLESKTVPAILAKYRDELKIRASGLDIPYRENGDKITMRMLLQGDFLSGHPINAQSASNLVLFKRFAGFLPDDKLSESDYQPILNHYALISDVKFTIDEDVKSTIEKCSQFIDVILEPKFPDALEIAAGRVYNLLKFRANNPANIDALFFTIMRFETLHIMRTLLSKFWFLTEPLNMIIPRIKPSKLTNEASAYILPAVYSFISLSAFYSRHAGFHILFCNLFPFLVPDIQYSGNIINNKLEFGAIGWPSTRTEMFMRTLLFENYWLSLNNPIYLFTLVRNERIMRILPTIVRQDCSHRKYSSSGLEYQLLMGDIYHIYMDATLHTGNFALLNKLSGFLGKELQRGEEAGTLVKMLSVNFNLMTRSMPDLWCRKRECELIVGLLKPLYSGFRDEVSASINPFEFGKYNNVTYKRAVQNMLTTKKTDKISEDFLYWYGRALSIITRLTTDMTSAPTIELIENFLGLRHGIATDFAAMLVGYGEFYIVNRISEAWTTTLRPLDLLRIHGQLASVILKETMTNVPSPVGALLAKENLFNVETIDNRADFEHILQLHRLDVTSMIGGLQLMQRLYMVAQNLGNQYATLAIVTYLLEVERTLTGSSAPSSSIGIITINDALIHLGMFTTVLMPFIHDDVITMVIDEIPKKLKHAEFQTKTIAQLKSTFWANKAKIPSNRWDIIRSHGQTAWLVEDFMWRFGLYDSTVRVHDRIIQANQIFVDPHATPIGIVGPQALVTYASSSTLLKLEEALYQKLLVLFKDFSALDMNSSFAVKLSERGNMSNLIISLFQAPSPFKPTKFNTGFASPIGKMAIVEKGPDLSKKSSASSNRLESTIRGYRVPQSIVGDALPVGEKAFSRVSFSAEEIFAEAKRQNIDFAVVKPEDLVRGIKVELEHGNDPESPQTNVTDDSLALTMKIALRHMAELPDYYRPRAEALPGSKTVSLEEWEEGKKVYWSGKQKEVPAVINAEYWKGVNELKEKELVQAIKNQVENYV